MYPSPTSFTVKSAAARVVANSVTLEFAMRSILLTVFAVSAGMFGAAKSDAPRPEAAVPIKVEAEKYEVRTLPAIYTSQPEVSKVSVRLRAAPSCVNGQCSPAAQGPCAAGGCEKGSCSTAGACGASGCGAAGSCNTSAMHSGQGDTRFGSRVRGIRPMRNFRARCRGC